MADDSTPLPAWPPASLAPRPAVERRAHSPCIGICRMDDDNRYCSGCLRTIDEIAAWSTATEETRWTVLRAVQERRAQLADKAGETDPGGINGAPGA
jgi:predicted Fe-S protein YdhL (DUF1289 family)